MFDYLVITIDEITRRVSLVPPQPPRRAEGLLGLVQTVVLGLLNNPGRSVIYPERGSGIPSLIGSNLSSLDPTEILAEITGRVDKVKNEILEAQSTLLNLTQSERLAELIVLNADTGVQIDEVTVTLRLISEAGEVANFAL